MRFEEKKKGGFTSSLETCNSTSLLQCGCRNICPWTQFQCLYYFLAPSATLLDAILQLLTWCLELMAGNLVAGIGGSFGLASGCGAAALVHGAAKVAGLRVPHIWVRCRVRGKCRGLHPVCVVQCPSCSSPD